MNYAARLNQLERMALDFERVLMDPDAFDEWYPQVIALLDVDLLGRVDFQYHGDILSKRRCFPGAVAQEKPILWRVLRKTIADLKLKISDALPEEAPHLVAAPTFHSTVAASTPSLLVLISHSSKDKDLADALVKLLRSAFSLPQEAIRCSSVDGHRLPAGVVTADQLRKEVVECHTLIGLITPNALKSLYVLFELGARWGIGKFFIPVLARGTETQSLSSPLADRNVLLLTERTQIYQLLGDLGQAIGKQEGNPAGYDTEVATLARIAALPA